jgi:PRTRC genetic system protein E
MPARDNSDANDIAHRRAASARQRHSETQNRQGKRREDALSTPLTVTATAAELDQDFARHVLSFSRSYQRSAANIREIEAAHAAAEERKATCIEKALNSLQKQMKESAEESR